MKDTLNQYTFKLETLDGEKVEIKYQLPPLRLIEDYIRSTGTEVTHFAFITKKKPEEMDAFKDESIYGFLDRVGEQMDPREEAYLKRQREKVGLLKAKHKKLGLPMNLGIASPPISSSKPGGHLVKPQS
tara:strand:+ start:534 stop:920 length:387 start_codon:yes stop_codon:yes gene_type:complete